MTFADFRSLFPTFPICLTGDPVGGLGQLRPVEMLRSLRRGPLAARFRDAHLRLRRVADGRPVGLVMPAGVRGGLILHDAGRPIGTPAQHISTRIAVEGPEDPQTVIAEAFAGVLAAIADSGWSPARQARRPLPGPAMGPQPRTPFPPPAELVRRLGPGRALTLLHWLGGALSAPAGFVGRLDAETFGVTATNEQIAELSGLTEDQVRRALPELEAEGLIARRHHEGRRVVVVSDQVRDLFEQSGAEDSSG
jgi:hypothetical protein